MALEMASMRIMVQIEWENGCRVSALFSGYTVFYKCCLLLLLLLLPLFLWLSLTAGAPRACRPLWGSGQPSSPLECPCVHVLSDVLAPSLSMAADRHIESHRWAFLAHIPGSSAKPLPWHRAARGVLFCTRGCVPFATRAPRRRSRDSFSSHRQSPCPYARAGKPRAGGLCHEWVWVTGENTKENEQLKNTA